MQNQLVKRSVARCAGLLIMLGLLAGCGPRDGQVVKRGGVQQDVSMVSASNRKMNRAFEEARRTVPKFIAALKQPRAGQTGFTVKVKVTDGQATEYMWLKKLTYNGTHFQGQLMDDPYEVKGYHMGQAVSVAPSEIADWMFDDNGTSEGGFTQKVLDELEPHKGS